MSAGTEWQSSNISELAHKAPNRLGARRRPNNQSAPFVTVWRSGVRQRLWELSISKTCSTSIHNGTVKNLNVCWHWWQSSNISALTQKAPNRLGARRRPDNQSAPFCNCLEKRCPTTSLRAAIRICTKDTAPIAGRIKRTQLISGAYLSGGADWGEAPLNKSGVGPLSKGRRPRMKASSPLCLMSCPDTIQHALFVKTHLIKKSAE
ncbi:hypothetical protein CEXT_53951 [Caerostris extrusa]|uniref:Uncharacterized protein n=1 Tax=Caerostris extrusa TaxID=172846 RepID=A0AAV4TT22_CAEEX|nr:hypothetical protein CEXT_53951 [Caerostris extrusa]